LDIISGVGPASCTYLTLVCTFGSLTLLITLVQSRNDDDDVGDGDGASYQLDMMRCLREVNVDNNTVGWCVLMINVQTSSKLLGFVVLTTLSADDISITALNSLSIAGINPLCWAPSRQLS